MKKLLSQNLLKIVGIFAIGIFIGWISNNYYYANFYEPSEDFLALLEEDDEFILKKIDPVSCTASSQLNEFQSCENLYDFDSNGWEDNNLNCKDQWLEFDLGKDYYIEFIVLQNYQYEGLYAQKDKIREFELIMSDNSKYSNVMIDSTDSQWFDIMKDTSSIRLNILSSWNTVGTENCHLQEFEIYGRNSS